MSSLNTVAISGNVGQEPTLRSTQSGTAVLSFSVCVNDRRRTQAGTYEDVPNWVGVTVFGNYAQAIAPYLHKGSRVGVTGKLHESRWQEQDGTNRSRLEVIASALDIASQPSSETPKAQSQQPTAVAAPVADTDIPF